MARSSRYSIRCPTSGTTTAYQALLASNPLSSSYTKLSFVCRHKSDTGATGNQGIFGSWLGSTNGDVLFRKTGVTLQLYVYTGGAQYGPASVSGGVADNVWQWRGIRFDGSLASGNRLAIFNPSGTKGTDAAGPASMAAMSIVPNFGYGGSTSMGGYDGDMRDAFLWVGKALPDSAYVAIANGVHPLVFGPTHWWPMDNTLVDLVGGVNIASIGTSMSHNSTQAPGYISLPSGVMVPRGVAVAAGVTVVVTATSWLLTGQAINTNASVLQTIAKATWNWTANAITLVTPITMLIGRAVWRWQANDFFWTGKSMTQFWFSIKSSIKKSVKHTTRRRG